MILSFLQTGQKTGNLLATVSGRIFVRVLLLQIGQYTQPSFTIFTLPKYPIYSSDFLLPVIFLLPFHNNFCLFQTQHNYWNHFFLQATRLLALPTCVSKILSFLFAYLERSHSYRIIGFCVGWIRFSFNDLFPCCILPSELLLPWNIPFHIYANNRTESCRLQCAISQSEKSLPWLHLSHIILPGPKW